MPIPPPVDNTYDYTKSSVWVKSGFYQQRINEGNLKILEIVDLINNKDPEAVVIFMGDHGPWRLRNFPLNLNHLNINAENLMKINESLRTFVDDRYHVFFSFKAPNSINLDFEVVSHATVFEKLFEALANHKTVDSDKNKNISLHNEANTSYIIAVEGKINENKTFWGVLPH